MKTHNDPLRPSKRYAPLVVSFNEDLAGSEFLESSIPELDEKLTAFVRKKRAQFKPRETNDRNESHSVEYWVFPEKC